MIIDEAVRAALESARTLGAPLLAIARPWPVPGGSWHITALDTTTSRYRWTFPSGSSHWAPDSIEARIRERGYTSLAQATREEWAAPLPGLRRSALFLDPEDSLR
ncbi:hypothetical protein OH807_41055 [Kitasatospora sp. NBC_01560]|uniref:hypothetical protein n=1 Tax=Kitasatospora sp. NBC_01560 TaxID=2975965 RepID=UPI003867C85C